MSDASMKSNFCAHCGGTTFCGGQVQSDGSVQFNDACATCKAKWGLDPQQSYNKVVCSICHGPSTDIRQPTPTALHQKAPKSLFARNVRAAMLLLVLLAIIIYIAVVKVRQHVLHVLVETKQITSSLYQKPTVTVSSGPTIPNIAFSGPDAQDEFGKMLKSFSSRYSMLPNELQQSALRDERKAAIQRALPGLGVMNWVGVLKSMRTESNGDAICRVRLNQSTTLENAHRRITKGTGLYRTVSALAEGDSIVFSGAFVPGERDYIKENSVTERGAMTDPEFEFDFRDIAKRPDSSAIVVTARQLFLDYKDDEVVADAKFKNKILEINGTIKSVGKDIRGLMYVMFEGDENSLGGVTCYFNDKHKEQVAKLSKGDKTTARGKCDGKFLNIYVLRDCELVTQRPQTPK